MSNALAERNGAAPALVEAPQSIEGLLSLALQQGATVDVMERMMGLYERVQANRAKQAYDAALSAFQADCPVIDKAKSATNDTGKVLYKYAPLDVIVEQVKALLHTHGFSYSIDADVQGDWVTATVKVTHVQGHSEVSNFKVPIQASRMMSAPQQFASALTFAKRYAFQNAFGILTGDEDNDASPDTQGEPRQTYTMDRPAQQPQTPGPVQRAEQAREAQQVPPNELGTDLFFNFIVVKGEKGATKGNPPREKFNMLIEVSDFKGWVDTFDFGAIRRATGREDWWNYTGPMRGIIDGIKGVWVGNSGKRYTISEVTIPTPGGVTADDIADVFDAEFTELEQYAGADLGPPLDLGDNFSNGLSPGV